LERRRSQVKLLVQTAYVLATLVDEFIRQNPPIAAASAVFDLRVRV
jgi:hypothetical protein